MIALDTNVVVRLLVQDDPEQARAAQALLTSISTDRKAFISTIVLVETYWVLTRSYSIRPAEALAALEELVALEDVAIEAPQTVRRALQAARQGADLPDALIDAAASSHGCTTVASFDRRARRALGWSDPSRCQ